jgi:uncharacterized membrane protein
VDTLYLPLKFLHIVAASVWVGGLVTSIVLQARLARESDPRVVEAMARQDQRIGMRVLGPSAGLTLITGGAAMAVAGFGFVTWIVWGLAAIAGAMAIGATVMRRTVNELVERVVTDGGKDSSVAALKRRLSIVQGVLIVILLSAMWAMVFKPA